MKGKITEKLHNIWMAETKGEAQKALKAFVKRYTEKYPRATECLLKDAEQLLTFYDFPAAHWRSLRTTNPIESTFATVRHRTSRAKGCVSRRSMLAFAFKLVMSASQTWNRLVGFQRLAEVISCVKFIDGLSEEDLKTEENSYEKEKEQDGSLAA
jgi:transposase-like protein